MSGGIAASFLFFVSQRKELDLSMSERTTQAGIKKAIVFVDTVGVQRNISLNGQVSIRPFSLFFKEITTGVKRVKKKQLVVYCCLEGRK